MLSNWTSLKNVLFGKELTPSLDDKILDLSKFKVFADNKS